VRAANLIIHCYNGRDDWSFHRDPFVAAVDEHYDYKAERKERLGEIQTRRARRLSGDGVFSGSSSPR
jgi:hypothetical protein